MDRGTTKDYLTGAGEWDPEKDEFFVEPEPEPEPELDEDGNPVEPPSRSRSPSPNSTPTATPSSRFPIRNSGHLPPAGAASAVFDLSMLTLPEPEIPPTLPDLAGVQVRLAVAGMPFAGKSTAVAAIAEAQRLQIINPDILVKEAMAEAAAWNAEEEARVAASQPADDADTAVDADGSGVNPVGRPPREARERRRRRRRGRPGRRPAEGGREVRLRRPRSPLLRPGRAKLSSAQSRSPPTEPASRFPPTSSRLSSPSPSGPSRRLRRPRSRWSPRVTTTRPPSRLPRRRTRRLWPSTRLPWTPRTASGGSSSTAFPTVSRRRPRWRRPSPVWTPRARGSCAGACPSSRPCGSTRAAKATPTFTSGWTRLSCSSFRRSPTRRPRRDARWGAGSTP